MNPPITRAVHAIKRSYAVPIRPKKAALLIVLCAALCGCPMTFLGQIENASQGPIAVYSPTVSDPAVQIAKNTDAQIVWFLCTVIEHDGQRYFYELQDFPDEALRPESRFSSRTWVNGSFMNGQLRLIGANGIEYDVPSRRACSVY